MSTRVKICPSCGEVVTMIELNPEQLEHLAEKATTGIGFAINWVSRALWCHRCETPWLEVWITGVPKGYRRELVGLPVDLLHIAEEGGGS